MPLFTAPLIDADAQASSSELTLRVGQAKERGMHEMLPLSLICAMVATVAVVAVLHSRLPALQLGLWAAARVLVTVLRVAYSILFLRGKLPPGRSTLLTYRLLNGLDGVIWGALGWALTPPLNLEIAIVTLGVLIGVACLGTCMQHYDMPSSALFIGPMTVPNTFLALSRHDDLGVFCALAIVGLMGVLLLECGRSHKRLMELLRLRFESEKLTLVQAETIKQASQLAETKSRFLATMSHEMRTPLHGILGLVRQLRQDEPRPHAAHKLDLICGSGEHLVSVINDILDFSRLEAGSLPVHPRPFNLRKLLTEVIEASNVIAAEKGLKMGMQLDIERHTDVLGDPVRLRQVLHNLVGNAIKFTAEGHVYLRVRRDADTGLICIEVEDSGIGIPAEDMGRVFEAFQQAEGTYQRRFGGTGLGLTISRELCRAMGGDLVCRSEPGKGSVFSFTLPLPVQAACARAAEHDTPARFQPSGFHELDEEPHVLLVEDNPVNVLVAEAELRGLGMRVTVMRDGRQAVDWLENQQADLVLMDCEMPELNGFEATRHIRERERVTGRRPVSIVALTANGLEAYANRCKSVGMNGHLAKPFQPDELARTLDQYLRVNLCPI